MTARRGTAKGGRGGAVCMDMAFGTCRTCGKVLARLVRRRGNVAPSREGTKTKAKAKAARPWYCSDRCMEARAQASGSAIASGKGDKAGSKTPTRAKKKATRMRKSRQ